MKWIVFLTNGQSVSISCSIAQIEQQLKSKLACFTHSKNDAWVYIPTDKILYVKENIN